MEKLIPKENQTIFTCPVCSSQKIMSVSQARRRKTCSAKCSWVENSPRRIWRKNKKDLIEYKRWKEEKDLIESYCRGDLLWE